MKKNCNEGTRCLLCEKVKTSRIKIFISGKFPMMKKTIISGTEGSEVNKDLYPVNTSFQSEIRLGLGGGVGEGGDKDKWVYGEMPPSVLSSKGV